jgi:hypothetical protein
MISGECYNGAKLTKYAFMKIQWNAVTWYSKLLALALFVALPFIGFYGGQKYEDLRMVGNLGMAMLAAQNFQNPSTIPEYYRNVAEWQTNRSDAGGFSVAYPIDFPLDDINAAAPSTYWRLSGNGTPGNLYFTLNIPKVFEPQTNFNDARLTVGSSRDGTAIQNCLAPDQTGGPAQATSTTMINGIPFAVFHASDAGAGNYYETTSYRALHAGQCYAIEYTVHSSQIANYPAEYHLQPFDGVKLKDVLDRIVGTFQFR